MCHTISWFTEIFSGNVWLNLWNRSWVCGIIDFLWCSQKFSPSFTTCKNRRGFSQWPGCVWLTWEFMLCHRGPGGGSESLQCVKRPLWLWHAAGWCKTEVIFPLWVKISPSALAASFPTHHFHVNSAGAVNFPLLSENFTFGRCSFGFCALKLGFGQKSQQDVRTSRRGHVSVFFFLLLSSVVITSHKTQNDPAALS